MKLGCSSWSYHRAFQDGRLDQMAWLRLCADELALDGVELLDLHFAGTDEDYLRELKRACTELHLTISCVSVTNDFGVPDAEERRLQVAKVKAWLEITSFLGAPILRVMAGWVHPEPAPAGGDGGLRARLRRLFGGKPDPKKQRWSDVTASLRECADAAGRGGIVLGLENHNGHGFVSKPEEVERCLRDVGSPWLRLCLDTGDYGALEPIRRTLSHAVHVHAKLYDLDADGVDGRQDWPGIVDILRKGGYRGFLSVEYEGEEDPSGAVPRGVARLRSLLREAGG